jgi:hypothetical protein
MITRTADPLTRIRGELVAAAARANRRRRHRRVLALVAVPVVLLAGTAGAVTVAQFSTGVAAVDELLLGDGRSPSEMEPGPGGASEPLPLPAGRGGRDAAAVAFVNRAGQICSAKGEFRRWDGAPRGTDGGGDCREPAQLARELDAKTAICCGLMASPEHRIYDGLAAGEVVSLRFLAAGQDPIEATLTPPWKPDVPGAEPLRVFVAVNERNIDVGDDGVQMDEGNLLIEERYRVEATLRDGRTVEVRTPWSR